MLNYEGAAGRAAGTPEHWPEAASVALDPHRPTLIMFAHPRCPCTRASVEQLNRLLARCSQPVAVHVLFLKPREVPETWTNTPLWRNAAAIPKVAVQKDDNGNEARRFGAVTSGYVVLYDMRGQLLFKGGITAGRGHAGDNAGADAITALLRGQSAELSRAPVYGCSLVNQCETGLGDTALWTK